MTPVPTTATPRAKTRLPAMQSQSCLPVLLEDPLHDPPCPAGHSGGHVDGSLQRLLVRHVRGRALTRSLEGKDDRGTQIGARKRLDDSRKKCLRSSGRKDASKKEVCSACVSTTGAVTKRVLGVGCREQAPVYHE